tara:strand:- start:3169 stop:3420 length:252 start_codon:yes stop_codon:yes gene_type:complete
MKIFNIFKKSEIIHIVDKQFNFIKENIKIKKIPSIGEKVYFDDDIMYIVNDVLHYVGTHHTIWLVVNEQSEENSIKATLNVSL